MKDDAHPTKRYDGQGNVHELLTPEMRQQVVQLKEQLEDYTSDSLTLFAVTWMSLTTRPTGHMRSPNACLKTILSQLGTQSKVRSQPLTRRPTKWIGNHTISTDAMRRSNELLHRDGHFVSSRFDRRIHFPIRPNACENG